MNGDLFNETFEEFICTFWDTGLICVSGRDVVCLIVGFLTCSILWAIFDGKEINIGNIIRGRSDKDIPGDGCSGVQDVDNKPRV